MHEVDESGLVGGESHIVGGGMPEAVYERSDGLVGLGVQFFYLLTVGIDHTSVAVASMEDESLRAALLEKVTVDAVVGGKLVFKDWRLFEILYATLIEAHLFPYDISWCNEPIGDVGIYLVGYDIDVERLHRHPSVFVFPDDGEC